MIGTGMAENFVAVELETAMAASASGVPGKCVHVQSVSSATGVWEGRGQQDDEETPGVPCTGCSASVFPQ